ncbi:MAG: PPC domain-containing protein [Deltaproteobacteria bacterium]|nr:PPC domain-containing protein [Deltaproteobacteria bacterium]
MPRALHLSKVAVLAAVAAAALASCPRDDLPARPKQCDPARPNGVDNGCLSDEICVEFHCVLRPKCEDDDACPSAAYQCVLPAQVCDLRPGFGEECSAEAPCIPGQFCALGRCRVIEESGSCTRRTDCPVGQGCDRDHNLCIEEAPCTLADSFPELQCDPEETCDALSGRCVRACQFECTVPTVVEDCGQGMQCNGSCECVQCIADEHCGPGLVCDARAGRCQSENLCHSDDDCDQPLICDPVTLLCQVPPPACFDDFDCALSEICNVQTNRCELPDGPCEEDRFEDHDTPADAEVRDVPPGGVELLDDLSLCPDDDDVYAVALSAGDLLVATVTGTDARARATLWLLDEGGETSLRFAMTPPYGDGRVQYVAQEDETVFLRLNALLAATPYDLTIERGSGEPCGVDFFEGANGNDSLLTATSPDLVPDDVDLTATLCPGDLDLFQLTVAAGEALSASLTFDGTAADLDLAFLDDQGEVVAQAAGIDAPELLRQRFFSAGIVYLRVRGFGYSSGPYTLRVAHEPPFVCADDAAEPDDDTVSAPVLPLGGALGPEARTVCAGDLDLITTPLEDFERLVVLASYQDADVELAIDVLDGSGTQVLASAPAATGGAAVSYDAQGAETVVVRVSGAGGAIGPYTLSVLKENQLDCAADLGEPNDSVAAATPVPTVGTQLSICESDQDYFTVDGSAGKKLVVDVSFRQGDGDLDVVLLGLDGQQVLAIADGTGDGEHLEHVLPLDGTYTLRVFSLTSGALARYSIATALISP